MNSELQRALAIALAGAEADEGVDVVILTGADPAFCAGLHLRAPGRTAARHRHHGKRSTGGPEPQAALRPRLEAQRGRRDRARAGALPQLPRRPVGDRALPNRHRRARPRPDEETAASGTVTTWTSRN